MSERINKFRIGHLALFVGGWDVKEYEDLRIMSPKYYKMQNCIIVSSNMVRWKDTPLISWIIFLQNDGVFIEAYPADLRKLQKSPFRQDHKRKMK